MVPYLGRNLETNRFRRNFAVLLIGLQRNSILSFGSPIKDLLGRKKTKCKRMIYKKKFIRYY